MESTAERWGSRIPWIATGAYLGLLGLAWLPTIFKPTDEVGLSVVLLTFPWVLVDFAVHEFREKSGSVIAWVRALIAFSGAISATLIHLVARAYVRAGRKGW